MVFIISVFLFVNCFSKNNNFNINEIDKIFKSTKNLKDVDNTLINLEKNGIQELLITMPKEIKTATYIQYLNDYAYFLSETDRYKEAMPILEKVIELSPDRVVTYLNLGDCYYKDYQRGKKQSDLNNMIDNYCKYIGLLKEEAKIPNRVKDFTNYKNTKYKDKKQNQINIGNNNFDFGNAFVSQYDEYINIKKYIGKYKENESEDKEYKNFYIVIKPIENPGVIDKKNALAYIERTFGKTNEIKIDLKPWKNFDEKEHKVNKLIKIGRDKVTYYILYFKDSIFLVESNHKNLEDKLFDSDLENLSYYKYQVDCGEKDIATIERTFITDNENPTLEYEIIQEKLGIKIMGKVVEKDGISYVTLKDKKNNVLLNLSVSEYLTPKMLYFVDENKDGFIDVGCLYELNRAADWYNLYIWNNSKKTFEKEEGIYEDDIYGSEYPLLSKLPIYGYEKDGSPVYHIEADDYYIKNFVDNYFSNLKDYINNNNFESLNDFYLISKEIMDKMKMISNGIQNSKGKIEQINYSLNSYEFIKDNYNIKVNVKYNVKTGKVHKEISTLVNIKFDIIYGYGSPVIDFIEKEI